MVDSSIAAAVISLILYSQFAYISRGAQSVIIWYFHIKIIEAGRSLTSLSLDRSRAFCDVLEFFIQRTLMSWQNVGLGEKHCGRTFSFF